VVYVFSCFSVDVACPFFLPPKADVTSCSDCFASLRIAAARVFDSKGRLDEWEGKQEWFEKKSMALAEIITKKVYDLKAEGADLEPAVGPKAPLLSSMNAEQLAPYLWADAQITVLKEKWADDFNDILRIASTL